MVRAAAGVHDPRPFDPYDVKCWRRLYWLLDEQEESDYRQFLLLQHRHWSARAQDAELSDDAHEQARQHTIKCVQQLADSWFPWTVPPEGRKTDKEAASLVDAYQQEFGKAGEPAYEAMVSQLVAQIKAVGTTIDHPEL